MRGVPLFEVDDLRGAFSTRDGPAEAARGLSTRVRPGGTVAAFGESGSGKRQAMMAAMGPLASNRRARGQARDRRTDLVGTPRRALSCIRGAKITMIFQEPMTSLDPLHAVGRQLAAPLGAHGGLTPRARPRPRASACASCASPSGRGGSTPARAGSGAGSASGQ